MNKNWLVISESKGGYGLAPVEELLKHEDLVSFKATSSKVNIQSNINGFN